MKEIPIVENCHHFSASQGSTHFLIISVFLALSPGSALYCVRSKVGEVWSSNMVATGRSENCVHFPVVGAEGSSMPTERLAQSLSIKQEYSTCQGTRQPAFLVARQGFR